MTVSNASLYARAGKDMNNFLEVELDEVEKYIEYKDTLAPAVSSVNVGWHLVHLLKVITQAYEILESSDPADYEGSVNLFRSGVFLSGSLPRGRGRAPKSTRPIGEVAREEILAELEAVKVAIKRMKDLPANANFYHGALGQLDVGQTQGFLEIHTRHHLKIIQDILEE